MFKDMSMIMTWYIWMVTYLRRNVTIVCGASYHILGSWISQDLKILFWLQVEPYISDWQFSESQHLASYVSRHNAMAYDTSSVPPLLSKQSILKAQQNLNLLQCMINQPIFPGHVIFLKHRGTHSPLILSSKMTGALYPSRRMARSPALSVPKASRPNTASSNITSKLVKPTYVTVPLITCEKMFSQNHFRALICVMCAQYSWTALLTILKSLIWLILSLTIILSRFQ
jgi:hypothetical protein